MGPGWDFLSAQLITLFKGFRKLGVTKFIYVVPWTYWKHRLRGAGAGGSALSPSSWFHMPAKPHTVYVCQTAAQTIKTWKSFASGCGDSSFIWSHLPAHLNSGLGLGVSGWKIQGDESFNGCCWFRKLSKHGELIIITLKQVSCDFPGGPVLRPCASTAGAQVWSIPRVKVWFPQDCPLLQMPVTNPGLLYFWTTDYKLGVPTAPSSGLIVYYNGS